jgi:uncharacterized protein (DUF111 family)
VVCGKHEPSRSWKQIREMIQRSKLDHEIKETGVDIFSRLAQAEAKIHGVAVDRLHFHEVGATDSIVDILAAAIGIREFVIDTFHFSNPADGASPVPSTDLSPSPARQHSNFKTLPSRHRPRRRNRHAHRCRHRARVRKSFGDQPSMTIDKIGYGTGQKEFANRPNLFRLLLGQGSRGLTEEEMLLETNIDDMNPQFYDHVMERLFSAGARDVFMTPIQMKKNRPATLLAVICEPAKRDSIAKIILQETTTIGVRYHAIQRVILPRESKTVKTRFGEVTVKFVAQPDGSQRATPEYDDLKRIAAAKAIPIKLIHDEILRVVGK